MKPIIGVVRWDAWIGDLGSENVGASGVGLQVERSLGPRQFHDRLPFFAKITGPDSVEARELTQELMDTQIKYAAGAGIGYWAMCWYQDGSGMDTARKLFLASELRDQMGYCFIFGPGTLREYFPRLIEDHFRNACYQTVLDGRPLVYLFDDDYTDDEIRGFRALTLELGRPNPYIVRMGYRPPDVASNACDGNFNTCWQAAAGKFEGEWIEVDFREDVVFDSALLAEADRTSLYEIQYWSGEEWRAAFHGGKIGDQTAPSIVTFPRVTASKARVVFLDGKRQPILYELQLFDTGTRSANLAVGRTCTSSSTFSKSFLEVDAASEYVVPATGGVPYATMVERERERWETVKADGVRLIPSVSTGWDARPRVLNPVSWSKYAPDSWCEQATPVEIAEHLREAVSWVQANPDTAQANSIIMYAWNEFDEGGWICPTLSGGTDRLDAIRDVLNSGKSIKE